MKKNHHYVPQFYLRNFSMNGHSIGMYLNKHEKFVADASIKRQAYTEFLYGETEDIENLLMEIEGKSSSIINRIINTQTIPSKATEEYHQLAMFLLLSEARVQKTANSNNELLDKLAKTILRMDKNAHINPEDLNRVVVSYNIPNLITMQAVMQNYKMILDLRPILIESSTDRKFITSDNPMTRYNQMYMMRKYYRSYGYGNMGIQLFFPLSPKFCLCLYDDVMYQAEYFQNNKIVLRKGNDVDELNKLTYLNSRDSIFFINSTKESYIRRLTAGKKPIDDSVIFEFGDDENKLIGHSTPSVHELISLPFVLNRSFFKMPLPPHMAGPIRPYVERNFPDK